jgi:transposase
MPATTDPRAEPTQRPRIYVYSPIRRAERPLSHLKFKTAVVQVGGYAGFQRLTGSGDIWLAACWSKF